MWSGQPLKLRLWQPVVVRNRKLHVGFLIIPITVYKAAAFHGAVLRLASCQLPFLSLAHMATPHFLDKMATTALSFCDIQQDHFVQIIAPMLQCSTGSWFSWAAFPAMPLVARQLSNKEYPFLPCFKQELLLCPYMHHRSCRGIVMCFRRWASIRRHAGVGLLWVGLATLPRPNNALFYLLAHLVLKKLAVLTGHARAQSCPAPEIRQQSAASTRPTRGISI